jgi:hypothetical protein
MLQKLRPRSVYDVMAAIAMFAALGTGSAYAVNEWNGSNIQDGTLTGADVQDLSIGLPDLGANSVSTGKIKDQDVRTPDLRDLNVTNPKIAWDSISSGKVINNNLTGDDVNESTLSGVKLSGRDMVQGYSEYDSNSGKSANARCPAGKKLTGTGYNLSGGYGGTYPNITTDVAVDSVIAYTTGVSVSASEVDGTIENWYVTAQAICANAE